VIALCIWFPATSVRLVTGNIAMWVALAALLATRWPLAGPWVLLKPSVFPFAVIGITRRAWWISAGVMVLLLALALPLTIDWLRALANSSNPGGALYSLQDVPLMLISVLALAGSARVPKRDHASTS